MTIEEKVQHLLGAQSMQICALQVALEEAQARIKALEETASVVKPNGKGEQQSAEYGR